MMSMKKRLFLAALVVTGGALPFAGDMRAQSGSCDGRNSWLVPSACTYCEWGGSCGGCQIKGCKTTS